MILSHRMHVHKPVLYAKALTTPSWPICSLFVDPVFCLSSISLSFLWLSVGHHILLGCLDLSHWCLSHKHTQSALYVCTRVSLCSSKASAVVQWGNLHERAVLSAHVSLAVLCDSDTQGGRERTEMILVNVFPPDQELLNAPFSDAWDFHSPSDYEEAKRRFCHGKQRLAPCTSQESSRASCLAAADLRSPSIVCLIDYFPCNYSCVTLNISALQEGGTGGFFLKDDIHVVTFVRP